MKTNTLRSLLLLISILYISVSSAQEQVDYIFADLKIDERLVQGEIELVTRDYQHYYILLDTFNQQLACTLELDVKEGRLHGEFWQNTIDVLLEPNLFTIEDGDVYVSIETLRILSLEYKFNQAKQWLRITTHGKHPKTQELIAQQRKELIAAIKEHRQSRLIKDNDYRLFTLPNIDINLALKHKNTVNHQVYTQLSQDILFHQADIQLSHSAESDLRGEALLSRKLQINAVPMTYKVGDMRVSQATFSSNVSKGVGVYFGQDERSSQKLRENISGYVMPGTEVALYQNDYLQDFMVANDDGFYEFKELNFRDSRVRYQLFFTYPDGQQERRDIERPSRLGLRAGQWSSEFTMIDSGTRLIGENRTNTGQKFAMANATYIANQSTLMRFGSEWTHDESQNRVLPFSDIEWRSNDGSAFIGKLGYGEKLVYDTQLNLALDKHMLYMHRSRKEVIEDTIQSQSYSYTYTEGTFKFDSSYYEGKSNNFDTVERTVEMKLGYSTDTSSHLFSWNNQIGGSKAEKVSFVSSLSSRWGSINLSASREFQNQATDQLTLSYNRYMQGYNISASLRHDSNRHDTTAKFRVAKSFNTAALSLALSHSTQGDTVATLSLSFSFHGKAPIATLSSSSLRRGSLVNNFAFLDENYNGLWDKELSEPLLNGVKLRTANQRPKEFFDGEKSYLVGIDAYDPILFQVDAEALDNPFLVSAFPSVQLESHPGGVIDVALPFYQVYEAEGEVLKYSVNGIKQRNSGYVPMEIVDINDGKMIRKVSTEQDGFIIIDRLKPGKYLMRVPEQYLQDQGLQCSGCEQVIDTNLAQDYIVYLAQIKLFEAEK
ncbi:hypothetical protein [Pseudoalteromonas sp. OANN1]|uniref:hypothetical protein n=1 Tax=Pseudoalteromonas sp. OANN1 TaxID=2954497 RepID=UPI002097E8D6|nr:hypothetical protein [Pseudoalteromonas sp. OANN1]MCO7197682.1 hypothetical protein [Pseudoalteromonas sp. OANN1]